MLCAAEGGRAGNDGLLRMTDIRNTTIEPAAPADLPAIRSLLEEALLPHADIGDGPGARFWVLRAADRLIGAVGLETHGSSGLLRSLVVAPEARGSGIGGRLVEGLEDEARRGGLDRLVLLTQTAEKFFSTRGYVVIDRASAPAEIRESSEFKSLCPASATCMSKTLSVPS